MNRFSLSFITIYFSFAFTGTAQHSGKLVSIPHQAETYVYSLSINKPKMARYLEPVPGAGFVKTDHEFIYFWRMNAEQIASWLENRTGQCMSIRKEITTEYYTFSIPNHASTSALIAAFKFLGIGITVTGHLKKNKAPATPTQLPGE